jgi:hypothetical protein
MPHRTGGPKPTNSLEKDRAGGGRAGHAATRKHGARIEWGQDESYNPLHGS